MLTTFGDLDRTFSVFDELRRRMDRVFDDYTDTPTLFFGSPEQTSSTRGPRVQLFDAGAQLVVQVDVPGLTDKDIQLTLHDNTLTIAGQRTVKPQEGYTSHRQERESYKFTRSFALPVRVDGEQTRATVKDGVLTVELAKVKEAQPKQIAVRAG